MSDLTDEQRSVAEKVAKLLETRGATEAEAQAKIAKAMELLEKHNLTMDAVEREKDGGGRRADEKLRGGFYQWERELWKTIAELNFCWYLSWWKWTTVTGKNERERDKKVFQHRVVGRQVNIAATIAMGTYLVDVTNRLTRARLDENHGLDGAKSQILSNWAISYREGIADRVIEKLQVRRNLQLSEEKERARAARKMAAEGASGGTTLTLSSVTQAERDANVDFVLGEGWSAKAAAERAEEAMLRRMGEQEYTQWCTDNPEKARERAKAEKKARRTRGPVDRRKDWGGYRAGYETGDGVSIDLQAEEKKPRGLL